VVVLKSRRGRVNGRGVVQEKQGARGQGR
jgi:hypothetical protein